MKKGKLSKEEISFILENRSTETKEVIAEKLDRSVSVVEKVLNENKEIVDEPTKKTKTVKQDLFDRSLGRGKNAVVLTPAASQLAESNLKRGRYDNGCIHKIK